MALRSGDDVATSLMLEIDTGLSLAASFRGEASTCDDEERSEMTQVVCKLLIH